MTDPAQTKSDPLAALEKLLQETKGGNAEADKAAALAAQETQIAQMGEDHDAQDQAALIRQQAELARITETPEYQARIQQDTAAAQSQTDQANSQQGFEIKQISHTKI